MPAPYHPEILVAALDLLLSTAEPGGGEAHAGVLAGLCALYPSTHPMLLDEHAMTARQILRRVRAAVERASCGDATPAACLVELTQANAFVPAEALERAFRWLEQRRRG